MTWIKDAAWKAYSAYKQHLTDRMAGELSYTPKHLDKALDVYGEAPRIFLPAWKVGDIIKKSGGFGFEPVQIIYYFVAATELSELQGFSRVRMVGPNLETFDGLAYNLHYELVQSL